MRRSPSGAERPQPDLVVLAALFVLEACLVILLMGAYKKAGRPLALFVASPAGRVWLLALVGLAVTLLLVVTRYWKGRTRPGAGFRLAVALNAISSAAGLGTAEVAIRMLASRTADGTAVWGTRLLPRDWRLVADHNRAIMREASGMGAYLVFDSILGWDVGRSRASRDGLYYSSEEGVRSGRIGERFAGSAPRSRVALVGDSFTFGLEVTYENSWGRRLERELGEGVQVLNFAVDGYGVDQAYLKYRRTVRRWHPDVVIFGVIDDDLERTMGVYAFLTFPGAALPFPKPRMVVEDGQPTLVNMPLPLPADIFATAAIAELPFIRFDRKYDPWEWKWHPYDRSYLLRFLQTRYPRWSVPRPDVSDSDRTRVNGALLRSFIQAAVADSAIPLVVYFPRGTAARGSAPSTSTAQQLLRATGIPYLDMTQCVETVRPRDRLVVVHYSPLTNAAIARCLRDTVRDRLVGASRRRRQAPAAAGPAR